DIMAQSTQKAIVICRNTLQGAHWVPFHFTR
ncbi:MAG: hypothetical protein RLZZ275_1070, partial [Bacteroidota bacterium]